MHKLREIFVRKLHALMQDRRWSNADLARRLSTSSSNVSRWLQGERFPRDDQLDAMADAFGIPVSDLFTTIVPPPPAPAATDRDVVEAVIDRFGFNKPKVLSKKNSKKTG